MMVNKSNTMLVCILFFLTLIAENQAQSKRIVVFEHFDSITWTTCDPPAAAMQQLEQEEGRDLCLVTYQIGNSLSTQEHWARTNDYYKDFNKPRFYIDGSKMSNNYPTYDELKSTYKSRQAIPSPATIVMESTCPQLQGSVDITITNTSDSEIRATLQVCLTEFLTVAGLNGQDRETWTVRDMLPDAKGEPITLAPGESVTKNRSFAVDPGWKKDGCKLTAFIQAVDKDILQGCTVGLNQGVPILNYNKISEKIEIKNRSGSYVLYVPFTEKYTISVTDTRGRVLQNNTMAKGGQQYQFDGSFPPGMHIVRITTQGREVARKVLFVN